MAYIFFIKFCYVYICEYVCMYKYVCTYLHHMEKSGDNFQSSILYGIWDLGIKQTQTIRLGHLPLPLNAFAGLSLYFSKFLGRANIHLSYSRVLLSLLILFNMMTSNSMFSCKKPTKQSIILIFFRVSCISFIHSSVERQTKKQ